MDVFTRDDLQVLLARSGSCAVSIYMPTYRKGAEARQNPVRFKNLLRRAAQMLADLHPQETEGADLLQPAQRLVKDDSFWFQPGDGLALFVSPGLFQAYRLAVDFPELVAVSRRFHIKPLLPLLAIDGRFYILALSQKNVRFFRCTRQTIQELAPEGMPKAINETLQYDEPQRQLQFHTGTQPGRGRRAAMFHGHGAGIDDAKVNILRFCQQIDRALQEELSTAAAPLVLAGVDYLFSLYREANTYGHLLEEGIPGNPDELSARDLHQAAWRIVAPLFRQSQEKAADKYRELAGTGRTSMELKEVLAAAHHGRVEALFLANGEPKWGTFDPGDGSLQLTRRSRLEMTTSLIWPHFRPSCRAARRSWSALKRCRLAPPSPQSFDTERTFEMGAWRGKYSPFSPVNKVSNPFQETFALCKIRVKLFLSKTGTPVKQFRLPPGQ